MKSVLVISLCLVGVFGFPGELSTYQLSAILDDSDDTLNEIIDAPSVPPTTSKPRASSAQGSVADRTRLVADLFSGYNKDLNPDNVKVKFGVTLFDLKVRPLVGSLDTNVWLTLTWTDNRLQWDPEAYGGVAKLRLPRQNLWKPDINLYNSADTKNMMNCFDGAPMVLTSDGEVSDIPPCELSSRCKLNFKKDPYGEQQCSLKFGSWAYDGNTLDVDFSEGKESMDITNFSNATGFEIVSTTAAKKTNYYPCCSEPYIDLTYNITFKAIPREDLF